MSSTDGSGTDGQPVQVPSAAVKGLSRYVTYRVIFLSKQLYPFSNYFPLKSLLFVVMSAELSNYFFNRVFAVVGGGSGIGLATVKQLISLGARVSIADYRLSDNLANDVGGNERNLFLTNVDVTSAKQVEAWMQDTIRKWGRLDGAANLAGTIARDHNFGTILTTEDEDWDRVFAVNVNGTRNCVREQVKYIGKGYLESFEGEKARVGVGSPKAEGGSIVNTGSTLAVAGTPGTAAYAASKHAVLGLTRCVAKEVGPSGTRVNCINPYVVPTSPFARSFDV